MDNELLLIDRLGVIRDTINSYGEENFYLSFSGGKDSTVLHHLLDMAIPGNKIPRVFINTGIEYNEIVKFAKLMAENDKRFVFIKPTKPIKQILEKYGYPFKSKEHSTKLHEWQLGHRDTISIKKYLTKGASIHFTCPDVLREQFTDTYPLKISQYCCLELKKRPVHKWEKANNKTIKITGMMRAEGGQRINIHCITTDNNGKVTRFHPLSKINKEWEEWFIQKYKIKLCELYYEPYNFERTGCKGCPFALGLQEQLETMEKYLPAERKQCEYIWKPVYAEYRRLGYRLKKDEQLKLF